MHSTLINRLTADLDFIESQKSEIPFFKYKKGLFVRINPIEKKMMRGKEERVTKLILKVLYEFITQLEEHYLQIDKCYIDCKIEAKMELKTYFKSTCSPDHFSLIYRGICRLEPKVVEKYVHNYKKSFDYIEILDQVTGQFFRAVIKKYEIEGDELSHLLPKRNFECFYEMLQNPFIRNLLVKINSSKQMLDACNFFQNPDSSLTQSGRSKHSIAWELYQRYWEILALQFPFLLARLELEPDHIRELTKNEFSRICLKKALFFRSSLSPGAISKTVNFIQSVDKYRTKKEQKKKEELANRIIEVFLPSLQVNELFYQRPYKDDLFDNYEKMVVKNLCTHFAK